jgi:hypothetical protein
MSRIVSAPRSAVLKKPPHGEACNRCGLCCMMTLCPLGQHVFRRVMGPCPALEMDPSGVSSCGLVADPGAHALAHTLAAGGRQSASEAAKWLIASDTGCDARINGEPASEAFNARGRQWDRDHKRQVIKAQKTWRMP